MEQSMKTVLFKDLPDGAIFEMGDRKFKKKNQEEAMVMSASGHADVSISAGALCYISVTALEQYGLEETKSQGDLASKLRALQVNPAEKKIVNKWLKELKDME